LIRTRLSTLLSRCGWRTAAFSLPVMLAATWLATAQSAQNPRISGDAIINHLNAAIGWYRHVTNIDVAAGQPSDLLYLDNARNLASQALQLAFQSAQSEAALLAEDKSSGAPATSDQGSAERNSTQQSVDKAVADTANHIKETQTQIDTLNQQILAAHGKRREQLTAQRDALQGELELDKALQQTLSRITGFFNSSENINTGLQGKINDLRRSVPELSSANPAAAPSKAGQPNSKASRAQSSGLFGQASMLFSQLGDVHGIDQVLTETNKLRDTAEQLQAPLREALRATLQQGRDTANQPVTSDPMQAKTVRHNLQVLTAKFKQISDAAIPLRQEIILLDQCHAQLREWRESVVKEYKRVLQSLLTRVFIIALALAFVAVFSETSRRAIHRYVRDTRRRRQLLLLRRFVTGFLMFIVVALGFISEFSSLATFAGFLTAGIAVALQTVILSIAAYFFLIGRYGVRVGDRVTVSGVTGDVIDVGLVRLYLMELAGSGIDLYPTGRVVVFSNSVMFQAAPFFKQLPGTSYTWHEVSLPLSSDANARLLEAELLKTVTSVYSEYQQSIQRQHRLVEQLMDASFPAPTPQSQLRFGDTGLEFVVRYPVELQRASEIDDQVTRKLLETISKNPELKAAVTGSPRLRSALKAA